MKWVLLGIHPAILGGQPQLPTATYAEWASLKQEKGWREYDYREVYQAGGTNPREIVMIPASDVRIYSGG
jgi:hypothetical protein